MARKKDVKAAPFPEAIDGRPWTIRRSPTPRDAGVGDGLMVVPLGTDIRERAVRLHEMIHVKITDPNAMEAASKDLPPDILQNCEDARVHGQARRIGFKAEMKAMENVISDFEISQIAKASPTQLAALGAATWGTGEFARIHKAVEDDEERKYAFHTGKTLAQQAMHEPVDLPPWETTVALCQQIVDIFGDPDRPEEPSVSSVIPIKRILRMVKEGEMPAMPSTPTIKGGSHDPHDDDTEWLRMEIVEPPLTVKLPQKMRFKEKKIPEAYGRRLRRVGRLYHDGRVFARKIRKPGGGAVLIDVSGSMSLEAEDVLALCEKYPGGVIATYCSESDSRGSHGWLTVIARNGVRCEDELMDPPGGGNGVDGPALDWIAKYPGPRFWISDAGVHGGASGLAYCAEVCLRHNIKRVDNADEILGRDSS